MSDDAAKNHAVFVVKSSRMAMLSIETYLRTRGWRIESRANLREALLWILKNLPRVILIPADHPNRKLRALPRLLKNTYPCKVVGFTENSLPSSVPMINEMGAELNLYPPISGPAVERLLLRINKEWDPETNDLSRLNVAASRLAEFSNSLIQKKLSEAPEISGEEPPSMENVGEELSVIVDSDLKSIRSALHSSLISRGTEKALGEVAQKSKKPPPLQKIEKISNAACVLIESERFQGYLVAALGRGGKVDMDFIENVKKRLLAFLASHGENVQNESSFEIQVKEVEFDPWAMSQAEFIKKSIHDGVEVGMAFFPADISRPLPSENGESMFQVSLNDIDEFKSLSFDAYLFMPMNNKYLLYTPAGQKMSPAQKRRLTDRGVQKVHIRGDSVPKLKQYQAERFINQKIRDFEGRAP